MIPKNARLTLATLTIALSSSLLITACNDDNHPSYQLDEIVHDSDNQVKFDTIVAAAQATPDLSILVEAVLAADPSIAAALSDKDATLTVFAPSNEAFSGLLTELNVTKDELLANKALLNQVLTYHVVSGAEVKAADIPFGKPIESLEKDAFTINKSGDGVSILDARGRMSNITTKDVMTGNGVVHIIDKVILPADKNLVEVAQSSDDFSILVEAVVAAGLVDTLSNVENATVFAPTNTAFANLLSELGVSKEQLLADKDLLTNVLTYHVVGDRVFSSEVMTGDVNTLQGSSFKVNTANGVVITDGRERMSTVTSTDLQAANGVVHVIDKVILPPVSK